MKRFLQLLIGVIFLITIAQKSVGQNVNITTKINGFRHNWDCCNDGASILCIGSNFPDPRYKVWIGYNGTTFSQSTNGPGLYCGASDYTYGADAVACNTWNPGEITGPAFSNVAATSVNVDMQSWEDDGCGSNCVPDGPSSNPLDACFYNADDTRCGRLRIGDIDFSVYAPCSDQTYNGAFTGGTFLSMHNRCGDNNGAGYGLDQFKINWNFAAAPTVITHPSDASYGGAIRDVCTGLPITLTVDCNKFGTGNWTLGRWVKWQSSPDGVNWTDLGGTGGVNVSVNTGTTFTYNFTPTVAGTIYYRSVLSSLCNSGFATQTTNSSAVKFIVHDATTDPYCTEPLPLELISFTGYNAGNYNVLDWVTASELNTSKFIVEKSIDGLNWNSIGERAAAGNSSIQIQYDFNDYSPIQGNNYYRLKMMDIDGAFTYSNVINIPVNGVLVNGFVNMYPNPTSDILNIQLQSTGSYTTVLDIKNILGQVISSTEISVQKGVVEIPINVTNFANGTYIVLFADSSGKLHQKKFVKQ